ncbi:MAG: 4-alpha-glucanotransferase [candidate division FCPU426 bacterium]
MTPPWAGFPRRLPPEQVAAFRAERERAARWAAGSGEAGKVWPLIAAALGTASRTAIVPLQDLLELGAEARMNRPGTAEGNWGWRNLPATLTPALASRLAALTRRWGRA